jgi:hypothetical protein
MTLLNPVQKKLHWGSLVVATGVVFLRTRPYVMRNNAEFTIVTSFTSLCYVQHPNVQSLAAKSSCPPGFWTSDIQDLVTSCRKCLYFICLCVFRDLYTKMHQTVHSLADAFDHLITFLRTAQVCPIFALHEFITLENSIRFLYSRPFFFCLSFLCSLLLPSQFVLIICTRFFPFHTETTTSPFLQNNVCLLLQVVGFPF